MNFTIPPELMALQEQTPCSCMTEPHPGANPDPSMLTTTATPDGDDFLINARKWVITGPMARPSPLSKQKCGAGVRRCSRQT